MNYPIIPLDEIDSTNNYFKELLTCEEAPNIPEFTVVEANYQTAGKGQRGNFWESNRGENLLFSLLVKPHFLPINEHFLLSMAVSIALKESLSKYTEEITIKWPNDIYWRDQKIAGILIENDLMGSTITQSIVGIGVNVNQTKFNSSAPNPISLATIMGYKLDKTELLSSFMDLFIKYYGELKRGASSGVETTYWKGLYRNVGYHLFKDNRGELEAEIEKIDKKGRLYLKERSGEIKSYLFKEVAYII